ncbi:hypothetical protein [Schleiferilactobacillus harbinensis]|uniref:hypothetical protein n=1 Tax=Schleiferilactobacillus harbinensis TaxID=304207 RepID=UPI0039E7D50C
MATTPRNEQETIISYDRELDEWHYYSDVPKHNRKWRDLVQHATMTVEDNGDISRLEGTIGGNVLVVKRRSLSAAQRKEMGARLKQARERKEEDNNAK